MSKLQMKIETISMFDKIHYLVKTNRSGLFSRLIVNSTAEMRQLAQTLIAKADEIEGITDKITNTVTCPDCGNGNIEVDDNEHYPYFCYDCEIYFDKLGNIDDL